MTTSKNSLSLDYGVRNAALFYLHEPNVLFFIRYLMKKLLLKVTKFFLKDKAPSRKMCQVLPILCLLAGLGSANAQKITIKQNNATLSQTLDIIMKQTGYDAFFNMEILKIAQPVTINEENKELSYVLKKIFQHQPIDYKIVNKTIALYAKTTESSYLRSKFESTKFNGVIHGMVYDVASQNPLQEVSVYNISVTGNPVVSYSDNAGAFTVYAQIGDKIQLSCNGFESKEIVYNGEQNLQVGLKSSGILLPDVKVQTLVYNKKNPTLSVDLTNRQYMNLSQVLQGTIPGLSLQVNTTSSKVVNSVDIFESHRNSGQTYVNTYVSYSLDEFYNQVGGKVAGDKIIAAVSQNPMAYTVDVNGTVAKYRLHTSTQFSNNILPQIRGVNNFSGSQASMLIVIDGFPQDDFPADFPMANVESVDVVKDPQELIKWGARASAGIIMIKTKGGRPGTIKGNYTGSFYYSPAPKFNRKNMQMASSADYLDYMKEFNQTSLPTEFTMYPAQRLLSNLNSKLISQDQFDKSWDSLSNTDNESQIKLLQQSAVNQNHNLNISGGSPIYRFAFTGNYLTNVGNDLKSRNFSAGINWNNHFTLLNNKLDIDWLIKYSHANNRTGVSFDPYSSLQPYQLLLDSNNNYVYDYYKVSKYANDSIMRAGYYNYGSNILEDARLNDNTSKLNTFQTRYNMKWDLPFHVKWITSIFYNTQKSSTDQLYDKGSSYVRQLVDQYGTYSNNGVSFYVPYGDIMNSSRRNTKEWNIRTGLSYTKEIGKHVFSGGVGAGAASSNAFQPAYSTMYGYNRNTRTGLPINLPTPISSGISNFYNLFGTSYTSYPYSLLTPVRGDSSQSRSANWNGSFRYDYNNRLGLKAAYIAAYTPLYGQEKKYSTTENYNLELSGTLYKNKNRGRFLSEIITSVGYTGSKMPDLPVSYSNSRYVQSLWGNYTIWVNGLSPTQQKGQLSTTLFENVGINLYDSSAILKIGYNVQKIKGSTASFSNVETSNDTSYSSKFLSASIEGSLRDGSLIYSLAYSKSPEGQSQVNGKLHYNILKEAFIHSKKLSTLVVDGIIQSISPYQAVGLMMGTNVSSGGSYGLATNNSYSVLPPKNSNWEIHSAIGWNTDDQVFDLRYYNRSTSGLNNNLNTYTDPSTGLSTSPTTYSTIVNKGVEFFIKDKLINSRNFNYILTLNGAYNVNIAKSVPTTAFSPNGTYATAARTGYNTSNVWVFNWAGLNNEGDPQVYDKNGNMTSTMDSTSLAGSMVYGGTLNAPWTGGFIQEFNYKQFFARVAVTFQWGYVIRRYMPSMNLGTEQSIYIKDRWRQAGDENKTDIARISTNNSNAYRSFVIQNSSNGLVSGDNARLQEIMLGWSPPIASIKKYGLSGLIFTVQMQNVALWKKNKYGLDPATVSSTGQSSLPLPHQYSCSLNLTF